jgi:hypothetical protein
VIYSYARISTTNANGVKFGRKPILTPHQQQEARKRLEAGETQRSVARSYNVSQSTISRLPKDPPPMPTATAPKTVRLFMWEISSPLADRLFTLSNAVLIIGATMVLIGTIGAVVLSGVREQFSNARISDNETKTASATAEAAKAIERAAALEKEATQARASIAEAQARQKEAEERTEILRESFARNVMPRRFSLEAFENELRGAPTSSVEILYDSNVSDAFNLAMSMMIALTQAHWNMQSTSRLRVAALSTIPQESIQGIPWPLWVVGRVTPWGIALISNKAADDPDNPCKALQRAIHKSGAEITTSVGFDPKLPNGLIRVVIGDKTPSAPIPPGGLPNPARPAANVPQK